jgi:hypothetical protein
MRDTTSTTEGDKGLTGWLERCLQSLGLRSKSTASVSVDIRNEIEDTIMPNRNTNTVIDMTINIFRDYMRGQADIANNSESLTEIKRSFANARSCRMVAREGGFLPKFDRAVAADKSLRCFTHNDYNFGKYAATPAAAL